MFADDTASYLTVRSQNDAATLQSDLDMMATWESKWAMQFHPLKCSVLSITRSRHPKQYHYVLHGHVLQHETSVKYLGVTISSGLRWGQHINNICSKANRTLGFLKRNLKIGSLSIKERAYKALIRPSLEFASTVWDPYTKKNTSKIEAVQRRAARFCLGKFHNTSSVNTMLERLKWQTLETRRKIARLTMFFKISNGLVNISNLNLTAPTRRSRHHHSKTFQVPSSRTDYRKFSYFPRTIPDWNGLPEAIVSAPSLGCFKVRVAAHFSSQ